MKTSYHSYHGRRWRARISPFAAVLALLFGILPLLLAATAAFGGTIRARPDDSILTGPPPGPCAEAQAGPDYVGGTDVNGYPVVPADVGGGPRVTLNSETVYPEVRAGGTRTEVAVTVHGLHRKMAEPRGCIDYLRHLRRQN